MSGGPMFISDADRRKRRRGLVVGPVPEYPSQIEEFYRNIENIQTCVSDEGYAWYRTSAGALNNFRWLWEAPTDVNQINEAKQELLSSRFAGMQCHIQQGQNGGVSGPTPITVSIRGELQFVRTGEPWIFKNDLFWICPPFFFETEAEYKDLLAEEFHDGSVYPALTLPFEKQNPTKVLKDIVKKRALGFRAGHTPPLRGIIHRNLIAGEIGPHTPFELAIELRRRFINRIVIKGVALAGAGTSYTHDNDFMLVAGRDCFEDSINDKELNELEDALDNTISRMVSQIAVYEADSTGGENSVFSGFNIK